MEGSHPGEQFRAIFVSNDYRDRSNATATPNDHRFPTTDPWQKLN
jgi:hypothetical protein